MGEMRVRIHADVSLVHTYGPEFSVVLSAEERLISKNLPLTYEVSSLGVRAGTQ